MLGWIKRYTHWLHTRWPAGTVEKLPEVRDDGSTNVPGLFVVGDLTGVPLLKFAAEGGARAVRTITRDPSLEKARDREHEIRDLVIVGAGVSGMAAALEAQKAGLDFTILEATEPFSTIVNFPKGKPIYTYPTGMVPEGELQVTAELKEPLVEEMRAQTLDQGIQPVSARAEKVVRRGRVLEVVLHQGESLLAHRVIVAIGRSGNFRQLGVPGEELSHKVQNRLHDPKDFCGQDVLVVGGGDSALETAIAIASCGGQVTLAYRKREFSRPKPENVEKLKQLRADPSAPVQIEQPTSERQTTATGAWTSPPGQSGRIDLKMGSRVRAIGEQTVVIEGPDGEETLRNDVVFPMIGREAPLDFFRRSGVRIRGESTPLSWIGITLFFLFVAGFYNWKSGGFLGEHLKLDALPETVASWGEGWSAAVADRSTLVGTVAVSAKQPAFWFTLLYTLAILVFGIRRIKVRRTRYVTLQTTVLFLIQFFPLFLLPEVLLPLAGYNGWFDAGLGRSVGEQLFPLYAEAYTAAPEWGHPAAYWRAYGLILAWPLMVWNVMSEAPIAGWLIISGLQTFVIIPLLIWRWGKGAYCGWICSCGALAETLGDGLRHKMPHGPGWNRLNMLGQGILFVAVAMALTRIAGWIWPESGAGSLADSMLQGGTLSYKWLIDVFLAGVLGTGLYIKYSGRVWCRFACPLAALMHVYARFSRFAIVSEKKKCISCNVCTSVCHQGIDVMNFANKGRPMVDPQCVRCSACVQSCPTGVLTFGEIDRQSGATRRTDSLPASPILMAEGGTAGRSHAP